MLAVYGDWMEPALVYGAARVGLGKLGWQWPSQPPMPAIRRDAKERLRKRWMGTAAGQLTAFTIGVVATKPA